jgi:hypothetical protein
MLEPKSFTCKQCKNEFYRPKTGSDNRWFCSRSCSTKHNNLNRVKKIRPVKVKRDRLSITLQELKDNYSIAQYHAKIRGIARDIYKQNGGSSSCEACGYSLHIDICHIKDVQDFPLTATLAEVNAINNLCGLDKRCHWEFDNGHLKLSDFR